MIPNYIYASTDSAGERYIFEILRDSDATSTWTVFHSLNLPKHISRLAGEIDFVILIPHYGILCLEVKGHNRIVRRSGSWYFGNNPKPDARGPFKQASEAAHSFRAELLCRIPCLSRVPVWSRVCMPFGHLEYNASEWYQWQLLQKKDSSPDSLPTRILAVLEGGFALFKDKFNLNSYACVDFSPADVDIVVRSFRGDFEVMMSPKDQQRLRADEVKIFTDEQYLVIDGLSEAPRALITGPAGTGKTCMAIEEARRYSITSSVLLVCYNTLLSEHIQKEVVDCANVKVSTISKLLFDHIALEHRGVSRDNVFWEQTLPSLFEDAYVHNGNAWKKYDTLIVDEAQDVARPQFLSALDILLKGGLATGKWRMFGDPERQAIYGTAAQLGPTSLPGSPTPFSIRINCRNTPRISKYAEMLGSLIPGYKKVRRPDNKIDPALSFYKDDLDQIQQICHILEKAYTDGFLGHEIVLLSSRSEHAVATKLPSPWKDRLTPAKGPLPGHIQYCTIHAFKGLDAPLVILTDLDTIALQTTEAIFYVGITRALHQLNILVDETAQGVILKLLVTAPK